MNELATTAMSRAWFRTLLWRCFRNASPQKLPLALSKARGCTRVLGHGVGGSSTAVEIAQQGPLSRRDPQPDRDFVHDTRPPTLKPPSTRVPRR